MSSSSAAHGNKIHTETLIYAARELALATRLKRLSEHLYNTVDDIYQELGCEIESRWFPVVFLLSQNSPMGISEIAGHLNHTHPAISQISRMLEEHKWIESIPDQSDSRRRLLQLSAYGKEQVETLKPVWQAISAGVNQLMLNSNVDLLDSISRIENELSHFSLSHDVVRRIRLKDRAKIKIIDFDPKYASEFKRLNYEWLERFFEVEPHDDEVLSNPQRHIIKPGGHIFFALLEKKVVGTCALIPDGRQYELSKMAVTNNCRGLGIGEKLAKHAISVFKKSIKKSMYLESNHRLKPALQLYEKLGFEHCENPSGKRHYDRADVYMVFKG
ncbi:MAG TPA: hypothetical protein DCE61_03240 [Cellvibrionales bacterium]|nr:hypothetical protein [Cellvibrionales bacterium]